MKKLYIITLICFLFVMSPAYSTMGIGVSPTKLDVAFGNENTITFKVKLMNSGNVDLKINISSNLGITPEKNNFILDACRCQNYCNIHVVECDELMPPDEFIITLQNPRKPIIDYITFSGSQLVSGGMVSTGTSAKLKLNITYNGQASSEEPKKGSSSNNPSTTTTIKTTTTLPPLTTTTVTRGVIEPSDINQSKEYTQTSINGNDDSFLYILIIGGSVSIPIIGYVIYIKIKKPEEDVMPQTEYPSQSNSGEPEVIDETKN